MADFAIFGDIVYAPAPGEPVLCKDSWAVCENGVCSGVFPELPDRYAGIDRDVFSGKLIIPGYTDLHLHAPQYRNIGLGMDLQLMQWLEQLTYPEEARFSDSAYADTVYGELADSLKAGSTVRACIFSSRHTPSTVLLMDRLEASGLCSYVGKVNMDCLCADIIREKDHQASLHATYEWLECIEGRYERTRPIITPRFVPCCSRPLMEGLGKLA
ncbi:MAG: amidohydrolase family protein, partial [Oscillospiraceae bacterium]|nr:amidohydrolase family protein [Oscillospiraceae bacterium]